LSYNLKWLLERGMFTTSDVMDALGDKGMEIVKAWKRSPLLAGIDVARSRTPPSCTVLWVDWNNPDEFGFYDHRILNWLEIHGDQWEEQYAQVVDFLNPYDIVQIGVDGQGMGDLFADRLSRLLPNCRRARAAVDHAGAVEAVEAPDRVDEPAADLLARARLHPAAADVQALLPADDRRRAPLQGRQHGRGRSGRGRRARRLRGLTRSRGG
jgi:hypothetical protein